MDWASLLLQLPIVAAFIWFVLEMDRRQKDHQSKHEANAAAERDKRDNQWRSFLSDERKASESAMNKVANRLDALGEVIEKHDTKLDMAIEVMKERTRSR